MYQERFMSPIGAIIIQASDEGVTDITVSDEHIVASPNLWTRMCKDELQAYFVHQRTSFSFPYVLNGSIFAQAIYQTLATISFGQVVSYGELAKLSGYPNAARAVGQVMHKNRLLLVIPCHRVIAAQGKLGGFAISLEKKKWLLRHENASFAQ